MPVITGQTNGANSSEFKLAKVALIVVSAATALAVALGYASPEQASEWNAHLATFVENVVNIAMAYIGGRSAIKAGLAFRGDSKPE